MAFGLSGSGWLLPVQHRFDYIAHNSHRIEQIRNFGDASKNKNRFSSPAHRAMRERRVSSVRHRESQGQMELFERRRSGRLSIGDAAQKHKRTQVVPMGEVSSV